MLSKPVHGHLKFLRSAYGFIAWFVCFVFHNFKHNKPICTILGRTHDMNASLTPEVPSKTIKFPAPKLAMHFGIIDSKYIWLFGCLGKNCRKCYLSHWSWASFTCNIWMVPIPRTDHVTTKADLENIPNCIQILNWIEQHHDAVMPRVDEDFRPYYCLRCTSYKNVENGGWVNWNEHFDIIVW